MNNVHFLPQSPGPSPFFFRRKMKMKILKRRVMMTILQLFLQNWKKLKKKELKSKPGRNKNKKLKKKGFVWKTF